MKSFLCSLMVDIDVFEKPAKRRIQVDICVGLYFLHDNTACYFRSPKSTEVQECFPNPYRFHPEVTIL
jgi:hypothetical protein